MQVVLAHRGQRDVADHDHLVEVGALDDGDELGGVHADPGEDLLVHAGDARGRLAEPAALGVLAHALEEQPDALLDLRVIEALAGHGPDATCPPPHGIKAESRSACTER